MSDALSNLLESRTVLVQAGSAVGTGTLIAPGMVLTCAHVVRHAEHQLDIIKVSLPNKEDPGKSLWSEPAIKLFLSNKYEEPNDNQLDTDGSANASLKKEYPDVAIIKIKREKHDLIKFQKYKQPLTNLREKQFFVFGFSNQDSDLQRNSAEGISLIYSGEQVDGIIRKLIFVQGHIRPGMSGAALVERESGQLIGIVQMTKSKTDDLGAYVIPVETIWQVIQNWHNEGATDLFINLRSKELEVNVSKQYKKDYPQFSILRKNWIKLVLFLILIFFSLFWGLFHTGWTTSDPITSIIFLAISSLGLILGGWLGKSVNNETEKFKDKVGKILLGKFGTLVLVLWSIALIYFWSFRTSISINGYSENEDVEISVIGGTNFKDTIRTITLSHDAKNGKTSDLFLTSPLDSNGKKVKLTIKDKGRSFYIDTLRPFHKIDIIYPRDFPLEPVTIFRFDPGIPSLKMMNRYRLDIQIERKVGNKTVVINNFKVKLDNDTGCIILGREIDLGERENDWEFAIRNDPKIKTRYDRNLTKKTWNNFKYIPDIDLNKDDQITIKVMRNSNQAEKLKDSVFNFSIKRNLLDVKLNITYKE